MIRAVAFLKADLAQHQDFIVHMSRCSPCFNDFGVFREQAKLSKRKRNLAIIGSVIVTVVLGILIWSERGRFLPQGTFQVAALDLTHRGALRGEEPNTPKSPLELSSRRLDLTIYLPLGSQPGIYELQILKQAGSAIWSGQSDATIENSVSTLHLKVDLAGIRSGQYFLAVRQKGLDWFYYPLVIR